jgi:deoxyribonuclease V
VHWAALDVDYRRDARGVERAVVAAVVFERWSDAAPSHERTLRVDDVKPYVSGRFFEREMPCLLAMLEALRREGVTVDGVVVDGYVWLAPDVPGLGARLWASLDRRVSVIGVAKTPFDGASLVERPVLRGQSQKPLLITAAGVDVDEAARWVRSMHGAHRVPTLLARVDQLSRAGT